jgi:hypothetical protein
MHGRLHRRTTDLIVLCAVVGTTSTLSFRPIARSAAQTSGHVGSGVTELMD